MELRRTDTRTQQRFDGEQVSAQEIPETIAATSVERRDRDPENRGTMEVLSLNKFGGYVIFTLSAVHTHWCPYWRIGTRHGACICGALEELDGIYSEKYTFKFPTPNDGTISVAVEPTKER